jgi:hypothetical protein
LRHHNQEIARTVEQALALATGSLNEAKGISLYFLSRDMAPLSRVDRHQRNGWRESQEHKRQETRSKAGKT